MARLEELNKQIPEKRNELKTYFDEHRNDDGSLKMTTSEIEEVNRRNAEIEKFVAERDGLKGATEIEERNAREIEERKRGVRRPGSTAPRQTREDDVEERSVGQLIVESRAYETRGQHSVETPIDISMRALFQTAAGITPETTRNRPNLYSVQPKLNILDLIPQTVTTQVAVTYQEETVYNNNSAEVAEGGEFPESELKLEDKSAPVKKIATFIPITDEQLEDVEYAQSYINNRLPFMLRQRLQRQTLKGNGVGANLLGLYNVPNLGSTIVPVGKTMMDGIFMGIVNISINAEADADAVIINPLDWQDIRLEKTDDGQYIWGHPSIVGPMTIFGINPIATTDAYLGRMIVGAYQQHIEHAYKRQIDVQVGVIDRQFVQGKKSVRADVRLAQVVNRPAAFSEIKRAA